MLKAKLQTFFAVRRRLIALVLVVIIITGTLTAWYVVSHRHPKSLTPQEQAAKIKQLNNESNELQVKGDYSTAAQKQIEAYDSTNDVSIKAKQAESIAEIYESARDYNQALTWYKKSLDHDKAVGDTSAMTSVQSSIQRVISYQQPSKPEPNQPGDGGRQP
jgi:hypothetical protein